MALTKKFSSAFGIDFSTAYCKIGSLSGNKFNVQVSVDIYANKEAANSSTPVGCFTFNFIPLLNGGDWDKQAYEELKKLPDFADTKAC